MASQAPLPIKFVVPKISTEVVSKINETKTLENYVQTSNNENVTASLPYIDPCIVDLELLMKSDEELQKFGSFISTFGYFQIVNHGATEICDRMRQLCRDFFSLPLEEKQKYARVPERVEGWGGDTMTDGNSFNWNDRVILQVFPVDNRNLRFWPDQSVPNFSEILEEYALEIQKVRKVVFKAICKYLNLEDYELINEFARDGTVVTRLNYYPPCAHPDKVIGLKGHCDVFLMTFVLRDLEVEGLQIEHNGEWFKVPIVPDAILVNVADMLEILTNGSLKSVFHRVVVNDTRDRISIGLSFGPPPNREIGPMTEFISDEKPQLYKSHPNYVKNAADNYAVGRRGIETVKIPESSVI